MSGRFADFVERADAAVFIVTAVDPDPDPDSGTVGGERSGCLVGFASQCSIEPPRLVAWVSTVNHTYGVATRAEWLAVHLVPAAAAGVAALFAQESGDWTDKFERCRWHPGPAGVPLLDDCPDRVVGRVVERLDAGGDHVGFVLDPQEVTLGPSTTWLRLHDVDSLTPGHPAD